MFPHSHDLSHGLTGHLDHDGLIEQLRVGWENHLIKADQAGNAKQLVAIANIHKRQLVLVFQVDPDE
ncbi:hypothetical protein D3C73_1231910 [compost metagenome]